MGPAMREPLLNEMSDHAGYWNLLISHGITRLAAKGWLFLSALVLVRFTPGQLLGPAVWGLTTMLATTLLSPGLELGRIKPIKAAW